ncbi:acyltransferase family protein [Aquihabitans sp. McL0605]|uniref:acyltransferase family protein n=1 Tax=Aquihabitans sp. McL0605 TaxID=3415671 RepID=UPI003CF3A199
MTISTTTSTTTEPPATRARARINGLDGLRAIAVIGVLLYHADVPWAKGGFIGVDIFFVLSGYLVTSIVLDGLEKRGELGFRRFWSARLRRLAPAQIALLVAVTLTVAIGYRSELSTLRGQVIAALTGTTNWYLIATQGSYFETLGRPPLLRHLWSLAIELQFYLVWPLVLVAAFRRFNDRVHMIVMALVAAILASSAYMAFLYHPNTDPTRAYFDTFARIEAPLVGALLALLWRPRALARSRAGQHGAPYTALAVGALAALVWMMHVCGDRSAFMYRGGFLLTALLTAVVVAGITHPNGSIGGKRGLGGPAIVAIGLRSYGLYLWHWPVFVLLRPRIDVGWSWGVVFVVRIVVTVVLAETCYRLIERPWHSRAPDASLAGVKRRLAHPSRLAPAPRFLTIGSVVAIGISLVILAVPHQPKDAIGDSLRAGEAALADNPGTVPKGSVTTTVPGATTDPNATTTTAVPGTAPVTLIGDSVMVGAAPDVMAAFGPRANIDAKVSRQADAIPPILRQLASQGQLAGTVVIQVGINGTVTEENLRDMHDAVAGRRMIILNARVPRSWETANNALVESLVPTLSNSSYIDWYSASDGHRDWFLNDGVHLTEPGRLAYADIIRAKVDGKKK